MTEAAPLSRPPSTREEEAIRYFLQGMLEEGIQQFEAILREEPGNMVALSYQGTIQELIAWGINPREPSEDFGTVLRLYHEKKFDAAQRWLANLLQSQPNRPEFRTMYLLLSEKILHETGGSSSGGFPTTSETQLRSGAIPAQDPMGRLARWIFVMAGVLLAAQLGIFFVFYPRIKRTQKEEMRLLLQNMIPQDLGLPDIDRVLRYYKIAKEYYDQKMYLDALDALKEARRFSDAAKKLEKLLSRLEQQVRVAPLMDLAGQLLEAKAYQKAKDKYQEVLKLDANNKGAKAKLDELEKLIKAQLEKEKEKAKKEKDSKRKRKRRRRRR